jgi:nucleotide-binding universal stress UspA family protein
MTDQIVVCLDGSPFAEQILPLAHYIAEAKPLPLKILRVVEDPEEFAAEKAYLESWSRAYHAEVKVIVSDRPAEAIIAELKRNPGAMPALTTHGRTAWLEAILGSIALEVVRKVARPTLLFRPHTDGHPAPRRIRNIVVALDGSNFAESIVPAAIELVRIVRGKLLLLQVLGPHTIGAAGSGSADIAETAYLRRMAIHIEERYAIAPTWDVLHGDPGHSLCRYLHEMPSSLLAITTYARSGWERAFLGSVAARCLRQTRLPILAYWPRDLRSVPAGISP